MTTLMERIENGQFEPPPVAKLLGLTLVSAGDRRAVFEMDAGERHWNPMGGVHGGVLCDLADAAMGVAYASTLSEGETFTSIELKINFLRPVREARLTAEGFVVNKGRTIGLVECEVHDAEGRLVAKAASTCLTIRPD